ncbi:MAG: hypothetical protein KDI19_08445, partial [Pseudomonadales bacterium]|nr:hypothetical protein [Pseudomonadales bacterium]
MGLLRVISTPIVKWLNKQSAVHGTPLSDYERIQHELRTCDVLLVEGRSRVSNVIRVVTQSPWTHAALYIGRIHDVDDPDLRKIIRHHYHGDESDRLVIESDLGAGTAIHKLEIYRHDHLRICRPSRLGHKDAQQVVRYAVSRLGIDYDVRQILDLARFLFPWTFLPRRWRSSLFQHNAGRATRTVCSTMIAEAFAFVQFPILPLVKRFEDDKVQMFRRNPKLCVPSDFDYSPYFEIIKYPFVDFHYEEDYHLLPWHGTGELSADESPLYMSSDSVASAKEIDSAIEEAVEASQASMDDKDPGNPRGPGTAERE